jgi:hypothetical protein
MRSKFELTKYTQNVKKPGGCKYGVGSKSENMDSEPKKCVKIKFGAKLGKSWKKVIAKIWRSFLDPNGSFLAKRVIVKNKVTA